MVVNVPQEIGQENQEGREPAQPDPFVGEDAALLGEQQADHNAEAEQRDGILLLHAQARDNAEPEPVARIVALDGENREIGATHPQIRFETVGSQQAAVGEVLRRDHDRHRAEQKGESPSAKFAGENRGLHHQKRRRQRRDKAHAAQRVSQHRTADVDQEGNERWLVDIPPGEVISAGHVIKLVAEVAIAIVEVAVKEQFGQSNGQNHPHAAGEERLPARSGAAGFAEVLAIEEIKDNGRDRTMSWPGLRHPVSHLDQLQSNRPSGGKALQ